MTDYLHLCTWSCTSHGSPEIAAASLDHSNGLSDYQVWPGHQVSSRQLNMFHAGRAKDKVAEQYWRADDLKRPWIICFENHKALQLWDKLVAHEPGNNHPTSVRYNSSM
uniref:RxLR effector candidate protein n=1 Tax=Hyaloperonospora arabidopsidis (strain Emoy2) TaxID=559515 RepID=M4BZX4_HYAAE